MWTMDYPTIRCEIEGGTAQELLLDAEDSDDEFDDEYIEDDGNDGGTLIRDANGKTYFIPEDLESFEVLDETERSELLLAPFEDRDELSISVASTGDPDSARRSSNRFATAR